MIFYKPDPKKATMKELAKETKQSNKVTELTGELAKCEDFFLSVIRAASVNIEKRRKLRVSDRNERDQVRDAVIGFLATEELDLDLPTLRNEQKLDQAVMRLTKITLKMQLMAPGVPSIGMKDVFHEMNQNQDVSLEPSALSMRAGLVDEGFVNKLVEGVLEGRDIKKLIHKLLEDYVEINAEQGSSDGPDFTQYEDLPAGNEELLKQFEELL